MKKPPIMLTKDRREALVLAVAHGINPKTDDHIRAKVIEDLHAAGLIHLMKTRKGRPLWKATDVGRGLVARTGLRPVFLHKRGFPSYTHDPGQAMTNEPEVISDAA